MPCAYLDGVFITDETLRDAFILSSIDLSTLSFLKPEDRSEIDMSD